jgi:carbon-monoxide dehydrogenase medium subunit
VKSGVIHHPKNTEEALALLADDPEARPIAGGASLVAMMNAGLVSVSTLVSLKSIPEVGFRTLSDGTLRIGAMTRHHESAESEHLNGMRKCLRDAAGSIGNMSVRNMGTIGGSVSLSDPGADYPAALVALRAEIEVRKLGEARTIPAAEFFIDWYTTARAPEELVTGVLLPAAHAGTGFYRKLARVSGDFAIASIAICISDEGTVSVAIGGVGPGPVFSEELNGVLSAEFMRDDAVEEAGQRLANLADPVDDVRATAHYRRLVIPRLLLQAVRDLRAERETLQ